MSLLEWEVNRVLTSRQVTEDNGASFATCEDDRNWMRSANARAAKVEASSVKGKNETVSQVDLVFRAFCDRWGGFAVICSRAMPILPEVVAVLAGLARMRFGRFLASLVLGTVPTAVLFAMIGHVSREAPWYGMVVAVALPLAIWPVFLHTLGRREKQET